MPASMPHRMLSTMAPTMLAPIVHSMIGTQSTSASGPPAAWGRTTTVYTVIAMTLTTRLDQMLRSS